MKYLLAIDQGTTSSRAIIFDSTGRALDCAQQEFPQYFPAPGLVEHCPDEIWNSVYATVSGVLARHPEIAISAIGITNQRETTVVWDALTGRPLCHAIVWQDRRTAEFCRSLEPYADLIRSRTGLIPDAYFSGTKLRWILDNVPEARQLAGEGRLRFGTVDSWLVWKLTGGRAHVTDVSNASRTMLFNINTLQWDEELLDLLGIPASVLPEVHDSSEIYGYTAVCGFGCADGNPGIPDGIPVAGILGDQQAALFGQMCTRTGAVKNTYGTGCFLLMNCGDKPVLSNNRLLGTVAWKIGTHVNYALEGSIFVAGSVVQWLRDGLGLIRSSSEVEALASSVPDNGGVYFVPALTGLGAPYWNPDARGVIHGLTRGTTAAHIARAALEGIAFQTYDVMQAMIRDAGVPVSELKVDGGASLNNLLMQFQADILGVSVVRPKVVETTALGASYMAGLATGVWSSLDELESQWQQDRTFTPSMPASEVTSRISTWHKALRKV